MCSSSSDPEGEGRAGGSRAHQAASRRREKREGESERGGDEEEGGGSEMRGLDVKTESVLSAGLDSRWLAAPPRMAALTASGTRCCLCHGSLAGWLAGSNYLWVGLMDGLSVCTMG